MVERTDLDHGALEYAGLLGHQFVAVIIQPGDTRPSIAAETDTAEQAHQFGSPNARVYKRTPVAARFPLRCPPLESSRLIRLTLRKS